MQKTIMYATFRSKKVALDSSSLRFNDQLTPSDVCFRVKSSRQVCWGKAYRLVTLARVQTLSVRTGIALSVSNRVKRKKHLPSLRIK